MVSENGNLEALVPIGFEFMKQAPEAWLYQVGKYFPDQVAIADA